MSSSRGHLRISRAQLGPWARFWGWLGWRTPGEKASSLPLNVDLTLLRRLEHRHVRAFIDEIEDYQISDPRGMAVFVTSRFRMPGDEKAAHKIAEWLGNQLQLGAVGDGDARFRYLVIDAVDMNWDEEGTRATLHLRERLVAGTRASIAAFLDDAPADSPRTPGGAPPHDATGDSHRPSGRRPRR